MVFLSIILAGKTFLALEGNETPLPPILASGAPAQQLACLSSAGRLLTFALDEFPGGHKPKFEHEEPKLDEEDDTLLDAV